ncbi:Queuosine salvage protein [Pseudocercospora fuligena]|uniref:Queuosine 5'-phosphate N-glycosylase/hydrolase n=1 Tax=Pseudocercospora fuligena TaxID=685502 RepID=A0A8H6VP83_9PEZI|nr:Queuosine salvage protein [Pseudocercospora fuligena]
MSDDEADPELLELLRQRLGISSRPRDEVSSDTEILRNAEFIYNNAIDVSIDMYGTKAAAESIYQMMQERQYSTETWSQHELHPNTSEGFTELDIVNFVFTMDLQNYSFWSELSSEERYQVEYRGRRWTGYNSLVACLRRALDEGIPITTPRFWRSRQCTDELLRHVFRSATAEQIPLLHERMEVLRESSDILRQVFPGEDDEDEDEVVMGAEDQTQPPSNGMVDAVEESLNSEQAHNPGPMDVDSTNPDQSGYIATDGHVEVLSSEVNNLHITEAARSEDLPEIDAASGEANGTTSNEPESQNGVDTSHQAADSSTQVDASNENVPQQTDAVHSAVPASEAQTETRPTDQQPDYAVVRLIQKSDRSAGKLVNLLAHHFPCFRDETRFEGRRVRLLKRAQIFVADLWAALNRTGLGEFHDIDHLTMFADYRVPQSLHSLGVLIYSPPLEYRIRDLRPIESGHAWEVQLRGCSIWAVELIRREILRAHREATSINAVLIDFFLYDLAKERESQGTCSSFVLQIQRCPRVFL